MELYHLRTFVTVAEEGHLTRAAERLFTSQPAISAHVKALEEELGVTLFDRTPKGMQLTAAGAQLLVKAQRALAAAGDLMDEARSLRGEVVGEVRIGLNSDAEFLRVAAIQTALSAAHPRLSVAFIGGSTEVNLPALRVGRLDAAFTSGVMTDPAIEVVVLGEEALAVGVPARLRGTFDAADVSALAAQPWVLTSPDCSHYGAIRALFDAHGCEPRQKVLADQEDAVLAMVKAGAGLGVIRRDKIDAGDDRIDALPLALPPVPLNFTYPRRRANDPLIQALVSTICQVWEVAPPAVQLAG
ncbi:LysR family transcriptional regulator [Nitrogeniibacter mangrovi]|uniref:LysR family transcriptional regulator n=1 Tax=Nitrogeniibacter mangrovi TaxID=2016596 RepID=A0A6C1B8P5_9RHOO|nr:LysR family transcriptional regulator [Nitrogeniibacter mangrovi]QID19205.1 LysR family transcriptional regulator [Nitrogeniibacter mangrovi]